MKTITTALKPSDVEIDPSQFENAHGMPARGRGSWAFCTIHPRANDYLDHIIWKSGTYAEARKAAKIEAAAAGISLLYLCS